MDVTLSGLLADIRRQGSIPNTASTGSADSDLIAYVNDALLGLAAEVVKCREGFYRRYKDHTLSSSQTRYRIPTRAIGNRLAAVLLLDGNGKVLKKLDEIPYSDLATYGNGTAIVGYHLEAGDLVLVPVSTTTAVTLRMVYYCRPGEVSSSLDAASGQCFTVTGVAGNVITLMSGHGLTTATKVDILKAGPPHEYLTVDELPSATTSTTVTVADGSRVEIGDFVCKADKAPVAQIPDAMRPVLVLSAAQSYWLALGAPDMTERLDKAIMGDGRRFGALPQAIALLSPRNEEGAKKIMSFHGVLGRLNKPYRYGY